MTSIELGSWGGLKGKVEPVYERAEAPGHARGRRYRRAVRATVGVLTALLWVGPLALADPGGGCTSPNPLDQRNWKPSWQSIPAPDYPTGPRSVVSYAASAVLPDKLLVTNGASVMSSTDGGCHWKQSFSLGALPGYTSSDSQIVEIVASRLSDQVAFVVVEQLRPVSRVHVAVTYNWGTSWESADQGLETALGSLIGFAPSPTNSEVAYLSAGDGASGSALFVTEDGGSSWVPRRTKAGGLDVGIAGVSPDPRVDNYTGVTVDPSLYTELWLPSAAGLYHSANGGRTLAQNPGVPTTANVGVVDVFHWNSTYPAWIRAFSATDASGYRSNDGGATFSRFATPGIVQSASNTINRPETVIATSQGVFVVAETVPPPYNVWNISPRGRRVVDVQAAVPLALSTTDTYYTVYARTDDSIERFVGVRSLPEDPTELLTLGGLIPGEIHIPPPHLTPRHKRIVLERGDSKTIDYDLVIPNSPSPLDVYFLVDVSGSMQDAINGIRAALQDIYDELNDSKINVYFGVGEYRSYTDEPAYHRILPISAPGPRVSEALNSLDANGGGEETQTEALYQAATGEGRDFVEEVPVGLPIKRIDAGQDAAFRTDALKVILMVTDEEFSQGGDHRPYPETIDALASRGIYQLGLAIQEGPRGAVGTPRYGLNRVATGTDSLAPQGGVDCDGNGSIDLAEGVPLVCVIDPESAEEASLMAPAIVNLLLAVDDPATVEIEPVGGTESDDSLDVIKSISPAIPGVNFKKPNTLDFDVTYRCPRLGKDKAFDVKLQAVHDGLVFEAANGDPLTTTTRVVCRVPIHEPEPKDPVVTPIAIVLPPIPPPPPRPPDIVTNPNPQPQGQAQANAALAAEKEQQPQLALAHQGKADEIAAAAKAEEKYAMSSYRDRNRDRGLPPEAVLMIGAASMCMMFGCATLAQQRARTQQQRR